MKFSEIKEANTHKSKADGRCLPTSRESSAFLAALAVLCWAGSVQWDFFLFLFFAKIACILVEIRLVRSM